MDNKTFFFDGANLKSIELDQYPDSAWKYLSGEQPSAELEEVYKRVAWISRGVKIRAMSLSRVPFAIVDSEGNDYDTSDDWMNKVGAIPNPRRLMWLLEESMTLMNRAYLIKESNTAKYLKNLKYVVPTTMTDIIDPVNGLTGFERNAKTKISLPLDKVIYFYQPSAYTEVGAGKDYSPAQAALQAAQVLYSLDAFANLYFKRGAIRATILSVAGNPPKEERERIETWWNEMLMGIKNAFKAKVFNAEAVKAEQIGDGLEVLQKNTLVTVEREDIATALGIPQSILFSNAANYATAQTDMRSFLENTIIPECWLIQDTFNEQLFAEMGYRLEFRPESLDAFKEDELAASQAYSTYVGAGMKPSIAAKLVGIEMPQGIEYEMLDEAESDYVTESPLNQELMRWKRKAENAIERGKSPAVKFESAIISGDMNKEINAELKQCKTIADVRQVFKHNQPKKSDIGDLVKSIEKAVQSLAEIDG